MSFLTGTLFAWLGHSCFVITTLSGANLLIDPVSPDTGYIVPPRSVAANVIFLSTSGSDTGFTDLSEAADNVVKPKTDPGYQDGAFSYTANGKQEKVPFLRVFSYHDNVDGKHYGTNTITTLVVDGLRICDLGGLGQSALTPKQLELIGKVDVLMIPVGGGDTIDGRTAAAITAQLRPKLIFPMHFRTSLNTPIYKSKLRPVDDFVTAMKGKAEITKGDYDRYPVSSDRLPSKETIVLLSYPGS